ncbi:replication-relaxation family protein [Peredibacter starrii]|uniref:Replication-relaxation family protein n=1 Tax=Peredibacter starrii TaxID=28202 RepID=A0AAX4HTE7_9BACT|nr:replication-relaxation family protein [Peredibacter starrii]WPU66491.1 replication-relaxation family protein [Peredibacter starrii]
MDKRTNINSLHLNYLTPLHKWRVMDVNSLRKECLRAPNYHNFCRVIRKLEKDKILEAYRDPYSRKKFVFLGPSGERLLSLKDNPTAISNETVIHDLRVSEITHRLYDSGLVDDVELEHEINDKRNFRTIYKIIPDAILHLEKNGHMYKIAFELELNRKSNSRITEKMKQYEDSTFYNYAMYLFPTEKMMETYMKEAEKELGSTSMSKFMFFCHPELSSGIHKPSEIKGVLQGKKITLDDVLRRN